MPSKRSKDISVAVARMQEIARAREASSVMQLPLWPDVKRGTPNSFIRSALFSAVHSKDRAFIKSELLFSPQGISIKFTGEQLNQEDLTLWETLVHMARQSPLGDTCTFSAHSILKAMSLNTGGTEHRRLHEGITRLIACAVEVSHEQRTYTGTMIEGSSRDEVTSHYSVRLNRDLIHLYGDTQWTAIDWQERLKLRRKPLAQALHAYYSSHKTPYPIKLTTLLKLTGSKSTQLASFKRQCRLALDELVQLGFLFGYSFESDTVDVKRAISIPRDVSAQN